ncbi:SPFH domain-containing protein [Mesorhizobium denitrificans]|uniref:Band 7 protein n=1 Tax=Mesorhizobium denitrificans TaxID=2294114 RepID=A0A371XBH7_9HYPH|nr:SPFH domain-containing protein [Mesorhizobium denitrificans]RFC66588.1 band 7 protein [Mesorhizobium denitrificans]
MAQIRNFGPLARLRSDASSHVIRYGNKGIRQSGRGLVFWFGPGTSSIAEVPMDDREATLFIKGRSQDFQTVTVQGVLTWRVADPEVLASRVDFSVALNNGQPRSEPIERIEARLAGLVSQAALEYLAAAPVRALLDAGIEPLRARIEVALAEVPSLSEIAVAVVAVRLASLTPTSELERALQTPTFEALQQKADEATFERRALAVEKERAISENELANKVELAKREKLLIVEEAENARNRATGQAEAMQVEAEAEAGRIRTLETAKSEAELARMAIYRDLPPAVMMGLAARELASKLDRIDHVNVTPDLLASLAEGFRKVPPVVDAS